MSRRLAGQNLDRTSIEGLCQLSAPSRKGESPQLRRPIGQTGGRQQASPHFHGPGNEVHTKHKLLEKVLDLLGRRGRRTAHSCPDDYAL